ncbi:MAG: rod shape-determining protein MreC [Elusimicrobia bacterium]|nr:rod shape-determining protein MreC [Elusimicrobiota bacterium]
MNTNKNTNKVFCLLLVISILLIVLRLTPTVQAIKQLAYSVLVPDIKFSSTFFSKTGNFILNLSNIIKVNQENTELKNENFNLKQELSDLQIIMEENERLKNLLSIKETNISKPVFANVIVREPTQWYKSVIIDKGSKDGIEIDNPVVAVLSDGQTCVFGRISEVYSSTSKVALITNPLFSVPVQIKDLNMDCVCDGCDSQYLKLSFIPDSADIKINDKIVTSPLSTIFEKGINVGKVVDIAKTNYGQYQEVIVEPYTQKQSIYEVAVLVKK